MPEIVGQTAADTSAVTAALALPPGLEIPIGRRAFAVAQALFEGNPISNPQVLEVGWHDSSVNAEDGSFAVVALGGGLDDLVGEIIRVSFHTRQVFAYVLTAADVPVQVSVTRRLFAGLNRLSIESLLASVVVVD